MNCWDFMKCGRIPGEDKADELGICPAYTYGAGQACWLVAGTFCGGRVQGTFAQKKSSCLTCEFYQEFDPEHLFRMRSQFGHLVFMTAVLDTVNALVVVFDWQGRIVRFNRACEQTTGYSFGEVSGRQFWDLFPIPEERESAKDAFEELRTAPFPNKHENCWVTKDGDRRLIAWSNTILQDDEGAVSHVIGTGIDITERRQAEEAIRESEERVRLLLNSTAEGIFGTDMNGNCTFANPACLRLLGFDDPSQVLGQNIHRLAHHTRADGTPYPAEECRAGQAARRGEGIHVDDEVIWRSDGTCFPAEYWSYPVRRGEEVVGVVVTFVDITERKRAEDAIRQSQEELRALAGRLISAKEEESKRLARELHDAFSQRLAVLGMDVSALEQKLTSPSDSAKQDLQRMGEAIRTLAEDVHHLSRQLHPSILDDLGLAVALRTECSAFSQQHGVSAKFFPTNLPDSLPDEISLSLYRIAQESLWNVAKHAQAQEVRLAVSHVNGELVLVVEDDGNGFDLNQVKGEGGLGLVSMEERARLVHGNFHIQTQPGRGTRVEVRIPLPQRDR